MQKQGLISLPSLLQHHCGIFLTNLRNQKYLVEHESDDTLVEDKGKIGLGSLTTAFCFGHLWLNNESSIDLKGKWREIRKLDDHLA